MIKTDISRLNVLKTCWFVSRLETITGKLININMYTQDYHLAVQLGKH